MAPVQIFLSTVSAEFASYRDALRRDLDRPNVTVKVQEDFIATGTETLTKLDEYIRGCDAVIHLVGDMTGALAQPPSVAVIRQRYPDLAERLPPLAPFLDPGAPALSYTQWEAWLALYHRKVLIIAAPLDGAPRDERYRLDEAQRAAQQGHLARLASIERYPEIRFSNPDRLAVELAYSKLLDILVRAGAIAEPNNLPYVSIEVSTVTPRSRRRMLDKVHHMWVEGVLEQSLYRVARIELGFAEKPEAVVHPWTLVAQQPELAPRQLPDGAPMIKIFKAFDETLLLLGAAGAGKTTLLLELARDLIERAKNDPTYPLPVVFNLSSWAVARPALADWLVDELNQRYDVPRKLAKAWIEHDQVLPLLDGLDEVARGHREACVEAINAFRAEHGLLPLVVSSRSADYAALSVKLRLPGAVAIQPLARERIDRYLSSAGTALSGVRAAVQGDETLWELLDTPLMLSILALAYQGQSASGVRVTKLKGTLEGRRAVLFDAYIEAMFTRRESPALYTPAQTRHWLSWLGQAMVRHSQTVLYVERMQPDWLTEKQQVSQVCGGGMVGGMVGVLIGVILGWAVDVTLGVLAGGLIGGATISKLAQTELIPPAEVFGFSWKNAFRAARRQLLYMRNSLLLVWLLGVLGVIVTASGTTALILWLVGTTLVGLVSGLTSLVIAGVIGGVVKDDIPKRTIPNEGIRLSFRHSFIAVSVICVFFMLLFWPIGVPNFGLAVGLVVGLLFGLEYGGAACFQHAIFRVLLWRYDYAPLNYVRFLEQAKDLLFLRRVGGGYIFVHRMLMGHFAGLEGVSKHAPAVSRGSGGGGKPAQPS